MKCDYWGDGRQLLVQLMDDPPDLVFNFAEGQGTSRSREARVPAVLELLGIPYTGSDPLTLAATLDKDCAKRLVASEGVAVPNGFVVRPDSASLWEIPEHFAFPAIAKPAWEGSSKGIRRRCLARTADELSDIVQSLLAHYQQPVLIEEFIDGEELSVGLVGNDPPEIIGVLHVVPRQNQQPFIYSLEVKRDFRRQVGYRLARLPADVYERVCLSAQRAYQVLGCRDVARIDFRLHDNIPYFLEANPIPGLNAEVSDLVILAGLAGWSYDELIEAIVTSAMKRLSLHSDAGLLSKR
ncbi:MAG: D-alanine--D-alanine ligase [Gemmatales bacterium]|nr:MAG: D-alanine--D-alanine ligase [Gemmatales bacterium]